MASVLKEINLILFKAADQIPDQLEQVTFLFNVCHSTTVNTYLNMLSEKNHKNLRLVKKDCLGHLDQIFDLAIDNKLRLLSENPEDQSIMVFI